jgi:ribosomal protein L24E
MSDKEQVNRCAHCGKKLGPGQGRSYSRGGEEKLLYCSEHCHIAAEPDGRRAQALPAEKREKLVKRGELVRQQRELKRQCLEEGVPWIH